MIKLLSKIMITISLFSIVLFPIITQASYNHGFYVCLIGNNSAQVSTSGYTPKPDDGDPNAYVRAISDGSNVEEYNAQVNVRVRDNTLQRNYATEYRTVSVYEVTYVLPYLPGMCVYGDVYRLFANVETSSYYPVSMSGVWCP